MDAVHAGCQGQLQGLAAIATGARRGMHESGLVVETLVPFGDP